MNRMFWPSLLFVAFFEAALFAFGPSGLLQDPDILWHIVVGNQIIDTGEFPRSDTFTFTFFGERWIPSQWLAECGMALLDRTFGFTGLALVTAAVLVTTYSWGAVRLHRIGLNWLMTLFVASLVMAASSYHFHARPHIFTILFSATLVERLAAVERGNFPITGLFLLVPLFCLWTNLHGGVLGGIGSLGLVTGGWVLAFLAGQPSPVRNRCDVARLTFLVAACILTIFLNPYGTGIPEMWLRIMSADLPNIIIEHAPLSLRKPYGLVVVVLAIFYGAVLASTRRFPRMTSLLALVWFLLAVNRIRHGPIFAVTVLFLLPDLLTESRVGEWLRRRGWFRRRVGEPSAETPTSDSRRAAFVALCPLVFLACYAGIWPVVYGTWTARPDRRIWPEGLREDLYQLQERHGDDTRVFNEQRFAGFILYNAPRFRVFVDGRCELFGEAFLRKYMAAQRSPEILSDWKAADGIQVAIVGTDSRIDHYFSSSRDWMMTRRTRSATLYERRSKAAPPRRDLPQT